jgi:hypothetical protein
VSKIFDLVILSLGLIAVGGCTQLGSKPGIERADDLGLQLEPVDLPKLPVLPPLPAPSAPESTDRLYRDGFVEQWMARSDHLCREYKDKIILVSRNTRFATDAASTILSGLATIFTAVGTIHPLTGAATIVSGVGAAAQTDTFEQQSGEIIAAAIQTARENQANQIENNLKIYMTDKYNIYRAQRDVIDYHNMCSLETALTQVRSSLKATSPDAGNTSPAAQGVEPVKPTVTVNVPVGGGAPQTPPAGGGGGPQISGRGAATPNVPSRQPTDRVAGAEEDEGSLNAQRGREIQRALCLAPDVGTVTFGPNTRMQIMLFRETEDGKRLSTKGGTIPAPKGLSKEEITFLVDQKCDTSCYKNAYEYYQFGSANQLDSLINRLIKAQPSAARPTTASKICDKGVRDLISQVQGNKNETLTPSFVNSLPREF